MVQINNIPPQVAQGAQKAGQALKDAGQALKGMPYVIRQRTTNPIVLSLGEFGLAIPFMLAYLYRVGKAKREGRPVSQAKFFAAFGEAAITSALVQGTKRVYPLLATCWTAYEIGNAETTTDKIKAAIKAPIFFALGWAGVRLGTAYNDALYYSEAGKIIEKLSENQLKGILDPKIDKTLFYKAKGTGLKPLLDALLEESEALRTTLDNFKEISTDKAKHVKEAIAKFESAKQAVIKHFPKIQKPEIEKLGQVAKDSLGKLIWQLEKSELYGLLRLLNPMLGYLIAITMIAPLVYVAVKKIFLPEESKTPNVSSSERRQDVMSSLWFSRLFGIGSNSDSHAGNDRYSFMTADGSSTD